ncbi:hypothetical protein [Hymenobacter armeniacus]|uniref:Lipoprotein n=1 Tax=Hymenobacter armeniacus TaxID=2771358 RepID=A0ABR8JV29_9BACT|nr:hypothetical protein [Hymenobacter armeniacus]MBD2723814.1 hypothetical protein [Hymenobacter armeniacus]
MRIFQPLISLLLLGSLAACCKDNGPVVEPVATCDDGSQPATVAHGPNRCDPNGWVLKLDGGGAYPVDALPASLQQDGLRVCVAYALYQDMGACPCCGGTRLRIQRIQPQ